MHNDILISFLIFFYIFQFFIEQLIVLVAQRADLSFCQCFFHTAVRLADMTASLEPAIRLILFEFRIKILQIFLLKSRNI